MQFITIFVHIYQILLNMVINKYRHVAIIHLFEPIGLIYFILELISNKLIYILITKILTLVPKIK